MAVDIEYPLPGDIVGPTFRAGGDYTTAKLTAPKTQKGKMSPAKEGDSLTLDNLPTNSKVICTLFNGLSTLDSKTEILDGAPSPGTWEVEFSLPPATNADDCHIVAAFIVGGIPNDNETTTNVDIHPASTGPSSVILTQP